MLDVAGIGHVFVVFTFSHASCYNLFAFMIHKTGKPLLGVTAKKNKCIHTDVLAE